ncbi:MAG: galactose-1-epimerase, partial [Verrucomicrobiota bacterium]
MKKTLRNSALFASFAAVCLTTAQADHHKKMIKSSDWGEIDGNKVTLYTLTNKNGIKAKISD